MPPWSAYCSLAWHARNARRGATARGGGDWLLRPRGTVMELEHIAHRIREEFREMPGLRLTPAQATRLWGLEHGAARQIIDVLVAAEFLRWTPAGSVTRF